MSSPADLDEATAAFHAALRFPPPSPEVEALRLQVASLQRRVEALERGRHTDPIAP